jgi:signal transduction histidine kinase
MERVRQVLSQERNGVVDRWGRQLKAAAAAGFALDPHTAHVLPQLLDATDRSLARKYRAVEPGAPALEVEARRAALQAALLADFLFDVALEHLPAMTSVEQRRLSEAFLQAAVEVLVKATLIREQEKRKRDQARLARLAHELRNSLTAARLAVDLLRRKGALSESRAARTLDHSLARLRENIEDTLFDEAQAASGRRGSRVQIGAVLADAHLAARELGALDKNVKIVLSRPPKLLVQADPRVLRPALRGLLRAGLQMAKPGSTIRVSAALQDGRARVGVEVQGCTAGKRLPKLPSLSFARRAAREQGGVLISRRVAGEGWFFGLDLPRAGETAAATRPRGPT